MGYLELTEMLQSAYSLTQALLCRVDLKSDSETFVNGHHALELQPTCFHMDGHLLLSYRT